LFIAEYRKILRVYNRVLHRFLRAWRANGAVQAELEAKMYLKRPDGPRVVTLPDGTSLSRADLPSAQTSRWVARRKAVVVKAVEAGLIDAAEACEMYNLSQEELESWCAAVATFGERALKTTALQRYRQVEQRS